MKTEKQKNRHLPWLILTLFFILLAALAVFVYIRRDSLDEHEFLDNSKKHVGLHVEELDEFYSLEEKPQIIGWFEHWGQEESVEKLALCGIRHEAFPMITWMPDNISFQDIIDGKYDDYIKQYLKNKVAVCTDIDVLIRFAHEMEVRPNYRFRWYSWQDESPETYKAAWIHMVNLSRTVSPNIKWVWSPNRSDEYSDPYYPGDDYVDYVGITMDLELTHHIRYKKFQDFYDTEGQRKHLLNFPKDVIVCEAGYAESGDHDEKAAYLESIYDGLKDNDELIAVVFFNEDVDANRLFRFTHNDRYLQVFYDGIRELRKLEILHEPTYQTA